MSNDGSRKGKPSSKQAFHFVAGLGSGVFTAVLLQPADLLKTRIQQSAHRDVRNPLLHTIKQILSSPKPVQQLWRGTVPSAWRTGLGSALYFGGLNAMRSALANNGIGTVPTSPSSSALPKLTGTTNLMTGAAARTWAGFVMMPITVIKVRYESSFYNYTSLASAAKDILRTNGLRGFFAGFGATAVRDAPYAGLYVLGYEDFKKRLTKWTGHTGVGSSAGINFLSGVVAATTATAVTNPFDAIKTRLQLMPQKYRNMFKAARLMIHEGGVRSMFDGLGLRMARKALSSALAWTVYEEIIRRAEIRWVADAAKKEVV